MADDPQRRFKLGMLALCVICIIGYFALKTHDTLGISGLLYPDGTPVGGDFINLWSSARLLLSGHAADIYNSKAFQAYELSQTGGDIGVRLWVYPPHSLPLAWPFGLIGFYFALAIWSALGLLVLGYGARRFGFDWLETAIILLSPASFICVHFGQTGNLAVGLLLLAMSARNNRDPVSVLAAAILTIKPQAGFLLPVLWLFQRRWWLLIATAVLTLILLAASLLLFGIGPWRDYLGDTLPLLSALELYGSGLFMDLVPSMFMSARILSAPGDLALAIHFGFAAVVGIILLLRLWQVKDPLRRAALIMIGTTLMTPYLHNYDLAVILCGALLVARRWPATERMAALVYIPITFALLVPVAVFVLNFFNVPLSPLFILPLLFLA